MEKFKGVSLSIINGVELNFSIRQATTFQVFWTLSNFIPQRDHY